MKIHRHEFIAVRLGLGARYWQCKGCGLRRDPRSVYKLKEPAHWFVLLAEPETPPAVLNSDQPRT